MGARPPVRAKVVVRGQVQGVFFRQSCRRQAQAARLSGWVRNRGDGAVEAAFEGDPVAVSRLVDWCRVGPPGAVVTDVSVSADRPSGERGFRIL